MLFVLIRSGHYLNEMHNENILFLYRYNMTDSKDPEAADFDPFSERKLESPTS